MSPEEVGVGFGGLGRGGLYSSTVSIPLKLFHIFIDWNPNKLIQFIKHQNSVNSYSRNGHQFCMDFMPMVLFRMLPSLPSPQ